MTHCSGVKIISVTAGVLPSPTSVSFHSKSWRTWLTSGACLTFTTSQALFTSFTCTGVWQTHSHTDHSQDRGRWKLFFFTLASLLPFRPFMTWRTWGHSQKKHCNTVQRWSSINKKTWLWFLTWNSRISTFTCYKTNKDLNLTKAEN